ncbi:MAG: ATP-dependent sacrificial sulfur transferase LarE [Planctomycetes bacterium]|nr:ATP-dependent sacrificial sulfur transferase LarE [Planctomycetota bacterium]MBI3834925.1 ATP-dependent sacrificial sulfur transferase LarE [Planctomycetota bacterium]
MLSRTIDPANGEVSCTTSASPATFQSLDDKYVRIRSAIEELESVIVAFSAGADSTLVLKIALDVLGPSRVLAVTGRSDSLASAELDDASRLAEQLGAEHLVIHTDEFQNPNYTSNPTNRCYFCKTTLYTHLSDVREKRGFKHIINGVNADDLGDYRPGLLAATEHAVRSPMVDAGLTKADVRELSRRLGLPTFDKPASPCLSSRIPYGEEVTPAKLRMIELAERFLRELGVSECRVRHHGNTARIEVPQSCFAMLSDPQAASRIDALFRSLGYTYVTLDLRGLRSGSMNEVIAFGNVQPSL